MKTAIYIEDGITQLVLTPENDFERNAMSAFSGKSVDAQLFDGAFYDCRGGWTRQTEYYPHSMRESEPKSIIIRVAPKKDERRHGN